MVKTKLTSDQTQPDGHSMIKAPSFTFGMMHGIVFGETNKENKRKCKIFYPLKSKNCSPNGAHCFQILSNSIISVTNECDLFHQMKNTNIEMAMDVDARNETFTLVNTI